MYFAHYRPQAGFKFALDGIHLAPKAEIPYVGIYGLHPPATLYTEEGDNSKIQLTSLLNWEGPAKSPQFLDPFITFKDMNFEKNLCIIIDIRSVNFSKTTPIFSKIGWTVCPIFSPDGYVLSGLFQIPLFKGEFPKEILEELKENDPWPFLVDLAKNRKNQHKITYLDNASVMVRLVDSQREGHFNTPWEVNRIDYRYIPQSKLRDCGYNATWEAKLASSPKLQSIVPNKGSPFDYNHKITNAFVEVKNYSVCIKTYASNLLPRNWH